MAEILFALKVFILAIVITFMMQIRVGKETVESHAEDWMRTSSVALYLQGVSGGAVLAIKNATQATSDFVANKFGVKENQEAQKSRLNLDIKRSQEASK